MTTLERLLAAEPATARRAVIVGAAIVLAVGLVATVFVHPLIGIVGVAGLSAGLLVLASIDLAFLAVVAVVLLLPFAALPINLGFNPTLLDLALGALYLIWAVRVATRQQAAMRWPPLSSAVALFIGLAFAALLAGLSHGRPTNNDLRVFGELVLATGLYFIVANLIVDRRSLRRVFLALVGLGTAAAAVGLILYGLPDALQVQLLSGLRVLDYPSGQGVLRYLNDDPSRLQRATGTSIDPNSFGGMLAVVAALLVPQVITRRPIVPRGLALAMTAIVSLALLATVSRGSLIGFAAALGVIGLVRDRRLLAVGLAGAAGLLAAARMVPWTAAYLAHFLDGLTLTDKATTMRLYEYRDAVRLIGRYPVFGVGFGGVRDVDLYRGVSSLYFIIAETMGLVGLTAFLAVVGAAAARITIAWRAMPPGGLRAVLLGCLAALTAALVSGTLDHYFFTYPHAFALLWLVLGLAMGTVRLGGAEAGSESEVEASGA